MTFKLGTGVGDIIGGCASLAALLEVSAYPKPGNVHRTRDFEDTKFEHFLAGSVSLGANMRKAAEKGELGSAIHDSVVDMLRWQTGGNVHLGIILLFTPIASAAGSIMENGVCDIDVLRKALRRVIQDGTPEATVKIYRAIDLAMSSETLGEVESLDVKEESSYTRISDDATTPIEVFNLCKERDLICSEWVTGFDITFTEGYPLLVEQIEKGFNINDAVLSAFIKILSDHPDSLIQRKCGVDEAERISEKAKKIHDETDFDKKMSMIEELDRELGEENGKMNPGTTADLTAASLFLLLLSGWRP